MQSALASAGNFVGSAVWQLGTSAQLSQSASLCGLVFILTVFALSIGCCCGLGWGLLIGASAPQATAAASRVFAAQVASLAGQAERPRVHTRGRLHDQ